MAGAFFTAGAFFAAGACLAAGACFAAGAFLTTAVLVVWLRLLPDSLGLYFKQSFLYCDYPELILGIENYEDNRMGTLSPAVICD